MIPVKIEPVWPSAVSPAAEVTCGDATDTTVLTPACRPWVRTESEARAFIDVGGVFVVACWVFSTGITWIFPPRKNATDGWPGTCATTGAGGGAVAAGAAGGAG